MCVRYHEKLARIRSKRGPSPNRVLNVFPDSYRWRFFFLNTLLCVNTDHVKLDSVAICSRPKLCSINTLLTRSENTQIVALRMGIGVKYQPVLFTYLSQLFVIYISWKQSRCLLFWCIICLYNITKSLGMMPCAFHMCAGREELAQIHAWKMR